MIKIAVLVKQVPKGETTMDNNGLLIRDKLITNPYDYYPLEFSLRLKDKYQAKVDVFTLAPPNASSNFKEIFALGVDECYHIVDNAFKGADVFATAYTLSSAIKSTDNYDLVICGRQTTDGDTSSVGGGVAENLGYPSVMYVKSIENLTDKTIIITRELTSKIEQLETQLPAVISVDKDTSTIRIPSLKNKLLANKKTANIIDLSYLKDNNPNHYGESGSKTKVVKIYEETPLKKGTIIAGTTDEITNFIISKVQEIKK